MCGEHLLGIQVSSVQAASQKNAAVSLMKKVEVSLLLECIK